MCFSISAVDDRPLACRIRRPPATPQFCIAICSDAAHESVDGTYSHICDPAALVGPRRSSWTCR